LNAEQKSPPKQVVFQQGFGDIKTKSEAEASLFKFIYELKSSG
jgi:hypothetical protein